MYFADHTGHLFEQKSYAERPIGYQYELNKYIFWFNNERGYKNSVDTYIIKPIRIVLQSKNADNIDIMIENSNKFSLLGSRQIQDLIEKNKDPKDQIEISEDLFTNELHYVREREDNDDTEDDLCVLNGLLSTNQNPSTSEENDIEKEYTMIPFYAVCNSDEEGTWNTNILIHAVYGGEEEWCPITIGAEIVDECEELIVNGMNMGVRLPKEILKALYETNYYNDVPDERVYAQKLKEYLMNYMSIRGEEGNYRSAINALKWFGWGDKVTIYKLLKTDNEFQAQYMRDNFDITNDIIYAYRYFRNEALIAISLPITKMSDNTEEYDFDNYFWGEDKPRIIDLFKEDVIVHYDEKDLDFHKNYFDFTFDELGLKLCMLKYYYEKYFLPIHLSINSLSMKQNVWMNDVKLINQSYAKLTAEPLFVKDDNIDVKFPDTDKQYIKAEHHIIDDNYMEFDFDDTEQTYDIYDNVFSVPIRFISSRKEQYYDAMINLFKGNNNIYSRRVQFTESDLICNDTKVYLTEEEWKELYDGDNDSFTKDGITYFKSVTFDDVIRGHGYYIMRDTMFLVVHPKTINRYLTADRFSVNDWIGDTYHIDVHVNGNNYTYYFTLDLPEMILKMGKLRYKYDQNFRQLCKEDGKLNFLSFMFMPGLVTINNIDYVEDLYFFQDNMQDYVNRYYKTKINILDNHYLNRCHLYKLLKNGEPVKYEKAIFPTSSNQRVLYTNNASYNQESITLNDATYSDPASIEVSNAKVSALFKLKLENNTFTIDAEQTEPIESFYDWDLYRNFFNIDSTAIDGYTFESTGENNDNVVTLEGATYDNGTVTLSDDTLTYSIVGYVKQLSDDIEKTTFPYDFYLMHNEYEWYVVLISKYTEDGYTLDELKAPELPQIGDFTFEYELSDHKFLVNRFTLEESNGINHFTKDDIIAFYLEYNHCLPYKVGLSTKWEIKPMSLGMSASADVTSPNEIAIVSVGDYNFRYEPGYYTIVCRYSIDDYIQHSTEKIAKFRIE